MQTVLAILSPALYIAMLVGMARLAGERREERGKLPG
jgi:hypothetical protein